MATKPKRSRTTRGFVKGAQFGETFVAKFTGRCRSCGNLWQPGDYISAQPGGGYGHSVCPGVERQTYRVAPE